MKYIVISPLFLKKIENLKTKTILIVFLELSWIELE